MPECCAAVNSEVEQFGIEYVTNSHYDGRKPRVGSSPHWLKISIGKLKNATKPSHEWHSDPDYYLRVFSWNSGTALPEHGGNFWEKLFLNHNEFPPKGTVPTCNRSNKCDLDFAGATIVIPYEASMADMFVVELHEEEVFNDHFIGRTRLLFSSLQSTKQTFNIGDGATIELTVETIDHDEDAAALLGGGPAACQWAELRSGVSRKDMCASVIHGFFSSWGIGEAQSCEAFIEDITTGALIDMHGHH